MKRPFTPRNVNKMTEQDTLVFPDAPHVATVPPNVTVEQAAVLNEQMRQWFPRSIPTREERLAVKVDVEFIL
jgi:hypothetical protein